MSSAPAQPRRATSDSVLFITLDSCRFDTFASADAPALKAVGPLRSAQAPSYFTYGSHSAMFVGFTPGATSKAVPLLNPKFAKLFKIEGVGFAGKGGEGYRLFGRNIVEGFAASGFATVGSGAVGWFNPDVPTGQHLSAPFQHFLFDGNPGACERQLAWLAQRLDEVGGRDVFAFLNLAETHVPYWHQGAAWSYDDNPCVPFQTVDRRADCAMRQRLCVEHVDRRLTPLLEHFADSTILLCADHGDAWGEDGVWEHGVAHPAVLTVPLLMRLRGRPI